MKIRVMRDDFRLEDVQRLIEAELSPTEESAALEERLHAGLLGQQLTIMVVEKEQQIIGCCVVDISGLPTATMLYICIAGKWQHKRLGTLLLRYLQAYLPRIGCNLLTLEDSIGHAPFYAGCQMLPVAGNTDLCHFEIRFDV